MCHNKLLGQAISQIKLELGTCVFLIEIKSPIFKQNEFCKTNIINTNYKGMCTAVQVGTQPCFQYDLLSCTVLCVCVCAGITNVVGT